MQKLKWYLFISLLLITFNSYADNTFQGKISPIPPNIQQKMLGRSWHQGCPVPLNDLAYLQISYWGFDDKPHEGELIINKMFATETVQIFKELFAIKYPIQEMRLYSDYPIADFGKHNDTVGFYCRPPQDGAADKYSEHAYGVAIDINPLVNPYINQSKRDIWPREGQQYLNRKHQQKGMIQVGDGAFNIFTKYGWEWGGLWKNEQDYMHFQKLIRGHYVIKSMEYIPSDSILLSPAVQG